jgi:hypothetical protein
MRIICNIYKRPGICAQAFSCGMHYREMVWPLDKQIASTGMAQSDLHSLATVGLLGRRRRLRNLAC